MVSGKGYGRNIGSGSHSHGMYGSSFGWLIVGYGCVGSLKVTASYRESLAALCCLLYCIHLCLC